MRRLPEWNPSFSVHLLIGNTLYEIKLNMREILNFDKNKN